MPDLPGTPYGYTMIDFETAVCPLPGVGVQWTVSGVQGNEAYFENGDESMRVELPFYDGGLCNVKAFHLALPDATDRIVWLLIPSRDGSKRMEVTVVRDGGLWFAAARLRNANQN